MNNSGLNNGVTTIANIKPSNQSEANTILASALQSLYEEMHAKEVIADIEIFKDAKPPTSIEDDNKLLLDKVIALTQEI